MPRYYGKNYSGCLNAMHEAEKTQGAYFWGPYLDEHLPYVVNEENAIECATAPQRAEAFLRTVGKWKDAA